MVVEQRTLIPAIYWQLPVRDTSTMTDCFFKPMGKQLLLFLHSVTIELPLTGSPDYARPSQKKNFGGLKQHKFIYFTVSIGQGSEYRLAELSAHGVTRLKSKC